MYQSKHPHELSDRAHSLAITCLQRDRLECWIQRLEHDLLVLPSVVGVRNLLAVINLQRVVADSDSMGTGT